MTRPPSGARRAGPLQRMADRLAPVVLTVLGTAVPKSAARIVVHSSPDFEDGALALLDELVARGHEPTVLLERPLDATSGARCPAGVRTLAKNSWAGRLAYLRARTVFTTHGAFRGHRPPATQRLVHLWHGEPVVKPSGRGDGERPIPSTVTTVLSRVGQAFRAAECEMRLDQVLVVGAPRNDRLLVTDRADARRRLLGPDRDTPVVAWLPTYRDRASTQRRGRVDGRAFDGVLPMPPADLEALDEWLGRRGVTLVAKPHPGTPRRSTPLSNIRVIDDAWLADHGLTTYELLAATDLLITDASSVWVDFLLLDRPVVFAFPDLAEYEATRGMNLRPYASWVPGPVVADAPALIHEVELALDGQDRFVAERRAMTARLHAHHDAGATARLLDALDL